MAVIVPIAITDERIVITQLNLPQIFLQLLIVIKLRLNLDVYCLSKHSVLRLIHATYVLDKLFSDWISDKSELIIILQIPP